MSTNEPYSFEEFVAKFCQGQTLFPWQEEVIKRVLAAWSDEGSLYVHVNVPRRPRAHQLQHWLDDFDAVEKAKRLR